MSNIRITMLTILALVVFAGIMLATSPRTTIEVNGVDNIVYTGIINDLYNSPNPDSLTQSSPDRFRWAMDYLEEFDNINLTGKPSGETSVFFYRLSKDMGKKFLINGKPVN